MSPEGLCCNFTWVCVMVHDIQLCHVSGECVLHHGLWYMIHIAQRFNVTTGLL